MMEMLTRLLPEEAMWVCKSIFGKGAEWPSPEKILCVVDHVVRPFQLPAGRREEAVNYSIRRFAIHSMDKIIRGNWRIENADALMRSTGLCCTRTRLRQIRQCVGNN
jgi:hypothetical protein